MWCRVQILTRSLGTGKNASDSRFGLGAPDSFGLWNETCSLHIWHGLHGLWFQLRLLQWVANCSKWQNSHGPRGSKRVHGCISLISQWVSTTDYEVIIGTVISLTSKQYAHLVLCHDVTSQIYCGLTSRIYSVEFRVLVAWIHYASCIKSLCQCCLGAFGLIISSFWRFSSNIFAFIEHWLAMLIQRLKPG